jgi:hypothetical protein
MMRRPANQLLSVCFGIVVLKEGVLAAAAAAAAAEDASVANRLPGLFGQTDCLLQSACMTGVGALVGLYNMLGDQGGPAAHAWCRCISFGVVKWSPGTHCCSQRCKVIVGLLGWRRLWMFRFGWHMLEGCLVCLGLLFALLVCCMWAPV